VGQTVAGSDTVAVGQTGAGSDTVAVVQTGAGSATRPVVVPESAEFRRMVTYLEAAIATDVSLPIREATYLLEGNKAIAPFVFEILHVTDDRLKALYPTMDFMNIRKERLLCEQSAFSPPAASKCATWLEYCKYIADPAYTYFAENVMKHPCIGLYHTLQLANPSYMKENKPNATIVRGMLESLVPKLLKASEVDVMINTLSLYQNKCYNVQWGNEKFAVKFDHCLQFWKDSKISMWRRFAHHTFLFMPSSANVERVFSFLKYLYTMQQSQMKLDKIEVKVKTRYNSRVEEKGTSWLRKEVDI
jgi:hypothetical protein